MKWMACRSQLGRLGVRIEALIVLSTSPSEPGSNDNEPNRGGGQSLEDQELNHSRRENDFRSGRYGRNGRYADGTSSDDQPISNR